MSAVTLIIWVSAAAGGLSLLTARLISTPANSACRRYVPACVSDLRPGPYLPLTDPAGSAWQGAMT